MQNNLRQADTCRRCCHAIFVASGYGYGDLGCNLDMSYLGPIQPHETPYRFNEGFSKDWAFTRRVESHTTCDDFEDFYK